MDSDPNKLYKKETLISKPNDGNVFSSIWLRRIVQNYNGMDEFLLDYGYNFLPSFGWFIYLIILVSKMV